MHGSQVELRQVIEPLFVKYGVDAVFAGHEHFYERIKPQKGIYYFTSGGGAKLRDGDIDRRAGLTEVGFDRDRSFMLVEIAENDLYFQTISRTGATVDKGQLRRREARPPSTVSERGALVPSRSAMPIPPPPATRTAVPAAAQ